MNISQRSSPMAESRYVSRSLWSRLKAYLARCQLYEDMKRLTLCRACVEVIYSHTMFMSQDSLFTE